MYAWLATCVNLIMISYVFCRSWLSSPYMMAGRRSWAICVECCVRQRRMFVVVNCFAIKGELFVTWSDAGWVETHLWSRLKASGGRHLCFLLDGLACTFEFWLVSYHHVVVLSDFFVCICEAIVKLVTRGSGVALESLLMESVWRKRFLSCKVEVHVLFRVLW